MEPRQLPRRARRTARRWSVAVAWLVCTLIPQVLTAGDPGLIFADGFESGGLGAWSSSVGELVPPPSLAAVTPAASWNGDPTLVSIVGTDFRATPQVLVGTATCTDVIWESSRELSARVPAGLAAGDHTVTVVNPDSQSAALAAGFRAAADPPPVITAVSPTTFVAAVGGTIEITGHDFDEGAMAFLSGDPDDPYQLDLTVSAADAPCLDGDRCNALLGTVPATGAGAVVVTVVNEDGQETTWAGLKIAATADGKLNDAWVSQEPLAFARSRHAATGIGEGSDHFLYVAGGDGDGGVLELVEATAVGASGTLTGWWPAAPLPAERAGLTLVGARTPDGTQYLFAVGGEDEAGVVHSTVFRARVLGRDEVPTDLAATAAAGALSGGWVYRVAAVTADGESLPSEPAAVTVAGAGVELSWSPVAGAIHYRVYRSDVADAGSRHLHLVADEVLTTSFTDRGFPPLLEPFTDSLAVSDGGAGSLAAGTYAWAVAAHTVQGETAPSPTRSLTVADARAVDLLWDPVPGALFYSIYRTEADGAQLHRVAEKVRGTLATDPGWTALARSGPSSVQAAALTLAGAGLPEGSWQYQVVAVDDQGVTSPASPFVVVVGAGQNAVQVEWDPHSGAVEYDVYRTDLPSGGGVLHRIATERATAFVDRGRPAGQDPIPAAAGRVAPAPGKVAPLPPGSLTAWSLSSPLVVPLMDHASVAVEADGSTFLYTLGGRTDPATDSAVVVVAEVDGNGHPGAWQVVTPMPAPRSFLAATAATAPGLANPDLVYLYAAQGRESFVSTVQVLGSWVQAAGLAPAGLAATGAPGGTLIPGSIYEYRVAAVFPAGTGPASAPVPVWLDAAENAVELTWTAEAGAVGYVLYRNLSGGQSEQVQSGIIAATTHLDPGDSTDPSELPSDGGSGRLSSWDLNQCLNPSFGRFGHLAPAGGGYMYLLMGEDNSGLVNTDLRGRILANGSLATPNGNCAGAWPNAGHLSSPTARVHLAGASAGAFHYAIGGTSWGSPTDIVESILFWP